MKKTVLAAALAAFATSVSAQNVIVYGVVDTAIQSYDNGSGDYTRAADNAFNTSRLGFKASEKLGGSFTAEFVLEGQISPASGTLGSTTTNQVFNREARVGLAGAFGEVRLGRTDTTMATEVDSFVGAAAPNWHLTAVNGTAIELGADQSNVVKYITPTLGGLQVEIGRANSNAHGATTDAGTDLTAFSARYSVGNFKASAGFAKQDGATSAAEREATTYGVGYDFGFARVGLSHATGDVSTTGDVTSKSTTASVGVPLSGGITLAAAYAVSQNGEQSSANEGKGMLIGAYKALSKRTTIYAMHTSIKNEANSSMAWGQTTAPSSAGLDPKALTIGIDHVF